MSELTDLADAAEASVRTIKTQLGNDVSIGSSAEAILSVTPANQFFTLIWGWEGVEGWDDNDTGMDAYFLIRRNLFDDKTDQEDEVMAMGKAVTEAMGDIVSYLELVAQTALSELTGEVDA